MKKFKLCSVNLDADLKAKKKGKDLGVIPFILTERMVDRDSEVIEPSGAQVETYKTNPIFAWAHDIYSTPPIGKVLMDTMEITENRVTADVKFDLNDPFASLIYNKYVNGFLNAGSIRFRPVSWTDNAVLPNQKGVTITEWELLEFSAVPIPANPGALSQKEIKGWKEELGKYEDRFLEVKEFCESGSCEMNADGWIDYFSKSASKSAKEENQDDPGKEEEEPILFYSISADQINKYIGQDVNIELAGDKLELSIAKKQHPSIADAILFLEGYDLTKWDDVALAMNAIFAMDNSELSKHAREYVFNELSQLYKQFKKQPPELSVEQDLGEPESELEHEEKNVELTAEDWDDHELIDEAIDNVIGDMIGE